MTMRTNVGLGACAAVLLLGACSSSTTDAGPHACATVGCIMGLTVQLDGTPPAGSTYQVVISTDTPTENVPIVWCTLGGSDGGVPSLFCNSPVQHSEFATWITVDDTSLPNVRVTVSDGATQIKDQSFPVTYTSSEINGPGCGVCTSARVTVTF